jgi:hypothetical protein
MKMRLSAAIFLFAALAFVGHLFLFSAGTYSWVSNGYGLRGLMGIVQICIVPPICLIYNIVASQQMIKPRNVLISSVLSITATMISVILISQAAGFFFPWIYSYLFLQIAATGLIVFRFLANSRSSIDA